MPKFTSEVFATSSHITPSDEEVISKWLMYWLYDYTSSPRMRNASYLERISVHFTKFALARLILTMDVYLQDIPRGLIRSFRNCLLKGYVTKLEDCFSKVNETVNVVKLSKTLPSAATRGHINLFEFS